MVGTLSKSNKTHVIYDVNICKKYFKIYNPSLPNSMLKRNAVRTRGDNEIPITQHV
jgi:hypothetical protein